MNYKRLKKSIPLILCILLMLSLTGCSDKQPKKYQNYIKSLIAINYLGATKDYISATGANEADATALYDSNVELLTNNLLAFYNIHLSEDSESRQGFEDLARNIYSRVNYKVSPAYKNGTAYLVDITIYPINLFEQTAPEVVDYISKFNDDVADKKYADYTVDEYEKEFCDGLLAILNDGCNTMTYKEPVNVTVEIIKDDNTFYISDYDFLQIDAAMISSSIKFDTSGVSTEDSESETETATEDVISE